MNPDFVLDRDSLVAMLLDARKRTHELMGDLSDDQLMGPKLDIVNPILWEIGHIGFFYEAFALHQLEELDPLLPGGEELYDSFEVPHDFRWDLVLPTRRDTESYLQQVLDLMIKRLDSGNATPRETYLYLLGVFHEDMHGEAFTYTRQTLAFSPPTYDIHKEAQASEGPEGRHNGDVAVPGGRFLLGANSSQDFVFDNEKWEHDVTIAPFEIARTPVTTAEFAAFVDDGGYERTEFWSYGGRLWLGQLQDKHPAYWRREDKQWLQRSHDRMVPVQPQHPMCFVNWHEAQAYCRWAGRRLPTEAEWELAASASEPGESTPGSIKRLFPWGDAPPNALHANLDAARGGLIDVSALPAGDSVFGCRQMLGNVWEWTASSFYPFPGYVVDWPYREYSAPWFGYQKVLRGGSWATRSRLIRNTYRNFYLPHRRDVLAGFRTCAKS